MVSRIYFQICSDIILLSGHDTQSQKTSKQRINPNQGPNLHHLPREEEVPKLSTTQPLYYIATKGLDSQS